jgi:serine-type D-Ala-D-Ala carboxypeptidase (penicillin-binding protein 5/6)
MALRTLDRRNSLDWGRRRRCRGRLPPLRAVLIVLLVLLVLAGAGAVVQLTRSVPALSFVRDAPATFVVPGTPPALPWPGSGEATVAVAGVGTLGSSGSGAPVPVASLTKVMTAYVIMADHPLAPGSQGPTLTMTAVDVAAYAFGVAQNQSVARVAAGEQITEHQALEAALVASANNVAVALARWDAGSEAAFVQKMNAEAARLGMTATHYSDSTGLSGASVSNATDQVGLAQRAMANPVFAAIVGEASVDLPVAGTLYNYDFLVGHSGIVGIKTGSTIQAGGCFLFAAHRPVLGKDQLVIGAVLGQRGPSILEAALTAGQRLIDATAAALRPVAVSLPSSEVGRISVPWGHEVAVQAGGGAVFLGWPGMAVKVNVAPVPLRAPLAAGQQVGTVTYRVGTQIVSKPATVGTAVPRVSLSWRLTRR